MSFLSYLINGISLGSVYAIIALGYTMVYGIAKMLNFCPWRCDYDRQLCRIYDGKYMGHESDAGNRCFCNFLYSSWCCD